MPRGESNRRRLLTRLKSEVSKYTRELASERERGRERERERERERRERESFVLEFFFKEFLN